MKKVYSWIFLLMLIWNVNMLAADHRYQVKTMAEADDRGRVLKQQPYSGWLELHENGTYKLQFHIYDEGTYRYVKANKEQPQDTIYFNSKKNFRFFGYPVGNNISVWLYKNQAGVNIWMNAALTSSPGENRTGTAAGNISDLIGNGVFTSIVMYGNSSAPSYLLYDRETGTFDSDEKGILFRPDGTYYLRVELGSVLTEERGNYRIQGNQIQVQFKDGSGMVLTMMDGGKSLHWYNNGMLISEYLFMGVVK